MKDGEQAFETLSLEHQAWTTTPQKYSSGGTKGFLHGKTKPSFVFLECFQISVGRLLGSQF